jgi:hypothetical protein
MPAHFAVVGTTHQPDGTYAYTLTAKEPGTGTVSFSTPAGTVKYTLDITIH